MEATPYQYYRFGPARLASRLPLQVLPTEAHNDGPAELVLDARAGEQRKLRVVHTQVDTGVHNWCAEAEHGQGDIKQRIDIGHTNQAKTHTFASGLVDAMVLRILVQFP